MAFSNLRNLFSSKRDATKSPTDDNKKNKKINSNKKTNKNRHKVDKKCAILAGKGSETTPLILPNKKDKSPTTMSLPEGIDENALAGIVADAIDSEELPTPPPSPQSKDEDDVKPSVFSVAQVSMKLNELWSTAKERLLGEDYWIPTNAYDVVVFPNECLKNYITSYPPHADEGSGSTPTLRVVQSQAKPDNPEAKVINHVVFSHAGHRETLSIYRTQDFNDAMDFCRRCEECRVLFKMLDLGDKYKDIRRQVRDLTNKFQSHPLWRMAHIAIACQRTDVFTEDGLDFLHKMGYSDDDLIKAIAQPEGKFAIHLAVESGQADIVKFLFRHGADVKAVDTEGNNLLHYAALTSTQMIELVWSQQPGAKDLLNALNNDRNTPVLLAIRNANPFCLKSLLNIGADMSIRIAGKNPLFEAVQSKGKTMDIIRAIIDAQPDLINEREEVTGNTVLHAALYKLPLMGVLNLRREELDLNERNSAGFTALQLFVSKGDVGMVTTLCSYGCDMDTQDTSGNTALHIAASKNNLVMTRLLLCLGANPNILNKHGDTPRHLAAKLHEHDLLKSLIMCNAKRCAHSKAGCVSGCVNEKMLRILPKTDSMQRVQSQADDFKSPRSLSKIEELEAPEEMVPQHSWNQFHENEHEEIFDDIITRLTEMAERKEKNRNIINALCLDGGGIRGLVLMQIMLEIERQMGEPIFPYFDWVSGTSTGALCAAALSIGKTCRDCQMIYLRFKDLIFDGWVRPYKSAILETFIKAEMGEETLVGDLDWPRLMFTTTRADVFPVQLEFMRNYQLPLSDEDNEKLGYLNPKDLHLWKAMRRSSAAPTYFSTVDNKYIDGGIMANNPTLDFLSEVQMWNMICKTLKRDTQVEIGCLLSIGTGVIPQVPMDASQLDISNNPYSSAVAIKNLGVILVDQVTATEGAPVNRASSWCITRRTPYFRLSALLHKEVAMDERDDNVLARMMWDCKEYMYRQRPYVEKICKLLRLTGPADSRRFLFEKFNCMATQTSRPSSPNSMANEEVKFKTASSSEDEISLDESVPKQPKSQNNTPRKSNSSSTTTLQASKSSNSKLKKTASEAADLELVKKFDAEDKAKESLQPSNDANDADKNVPSKSEESKELPKVTRSDMIKATQGERRKGDRDQSPKASPEEIKEAKEATTMHDAPDSRVTKGSPRSSTSSMNDLSKPTVKNSGN